jgi:hypothetical protein
MLYLPTARRRSWPAPRSRQRRRPRSSSHPAANFNGTVTIPFTVTDDDGGTSAPANEVITVTDVNDLPTATATSTLVSGNEDTNIAVSLGRH